MSENEGCKWPFKTLHKAQKQDHVIRYLKYYPEGGSIQDKKDLLPLHFAVEN